MGRKPSTNLNLPPRMRAKKLASGVFYYYDMGGKPRKWIAFGKDYLQALRQYADIEQGNAKALHNPKFSDAWARYAQVVLNTKAPQTQRANLSEIKKLLFTFGDISIAAIEPMHIRQYLDHYRAHPRQANKEIALFSHIFNCAREWGMTSNTNPCTGVKKHKTVGRKVYIRDNLYSTVYQRADQAMRDFMDFMYLSGQRNMDVLKADERHIINGEYCFEQGKSKTKVRVSLTGEFADLIQRIRARRMTNQIISTRMILDLDGSPMSAGKIRSRFDKIRADLGIDKADFQLRDLRAKAATDKEESDGIVAAQNQLGHTSTQMTRHYVRNRLGKKVSPTK